MNKAMLETRTLTRTYHDGTRELAVLRGVDLHIAAGEAVAIIGRSGTGKTTLLNCLGLLDRPTGGSIFVRGDDASTLAEKQRNRLRARSIGFVFQHYHLLADFNVLENVTVAGAIAGMPDTTRAEHLLKQVGLGDRLRHRPTKLSGGERQRVAIARALMCRPAILLCDEPTGNLDPATGAEVMETLWRIVREENTAMALVTHDEQVARRADRVLRLQDGILSTVNA